MEISFLPNSNPHTGNLVHVTLQWRGAVPPEPSRSGHRRDESVVVSALAGLVGMGGIDSGAGGDCWRELSLWG